MDESRRDVTAGSSDGEMQGHDGATGRELVAQDGASPPMAAGGPGDGLLGAGPGGFDEFGLKVKFRGVVYELTVNPPVVAGNGWSFAVSDTVTGKDPTTLASFLLVNSQSWSAVANAPRISDLFNTGVNIRQAALNVGAGPIATFSPTVVNVGGKITLTVADFPGTALKVTLFNNANPGQKYELAAVAVGGSKEKYDVTLKVNGTDVPAGGYSIHVAENTQDGVTVPAGADFAPYHELTIKPAS